MACAAAPISHAFGYILANVGGVEPFEKIDLIVGGDEMTGDDGFVFTAADESALRVTDQGLQALKPGARVGFEFVERQAGEWVITQVAPVKPGAAPGAAASGASSHAGH